MTKLETVTLMANKHPDGLWHGLVLVGVEDSEDLEEIDMEAVGPTPGAILEDMLIKLDPWITGPGEWSFGRDRRSEE